jgi:dTDP-4-amino-4,6-dideoxygalactose transaminase
VSIPFNRPHSTGRELQYICEAIASGQTSGNGPVTKKCQELFLSEFGIKNPLLTSSGTDALEMSAMLLDIRKGDEVIVPSYTFVSTANAFARQGAKIVFADSRKDNPCIDENKVEKLITKKTIAIVPVHYAGIACEMDRIMEIAQKHKLRVVEDAAHAFGAKYKGKLLGTIGHLGCFSFHETKIIHCGEGGMLAVNDNSFSGRAEIIWEKGTNRCAFHRGEVYKYEWLDTGSSFLMSDISAAFLYAQLTVASGILNRRKAQWEIYKESLIDLENEGFIRLPEIPEYSEPNYAGFFLILKNLEDQEQLRNKLNNSGIQAVTHYLDLSKSPYILKNQAGTDSSNTNSQKYQDTLLRLPLYHGLTFDQIDEISETIKEFFYNRES